MSNLKTTTQNRGKFIIDIYPPLYTQGVKEGGKSPAPKKKTRLSRVSGRKRAAFPFRGARSFALILMVTLNAAFINAVGTTAAAYFDSEGSNNNTFIAGKVDFVLSGTSWSLPAAVNLMTGTTTTRMIKVIPEADSNSFWYHASTSNFGIDLDFCATLSLNSFLEGAANYSGPLTDFLSPATTTLDDWQFGISTSINSYNKLCTFDFDFNAWQERHNLPGYDEMGYNDTEKESNRVASKGFRLNKVYYDVEDGSDDPPQTQCEARSQGYWKNNEGCNAGTGSADWNDEVNTLSATYSSLFSATSGGAMCTNLWIPSCPSSTTTAGKLCKAKAHTLADEMNVVSGKLDVNAILSGADDGNSAFNSLGLTPLSTIGQALASIEAILVNATSTASKINKAGYVAERIYTFYETENPTAPYCVYSGPSAVSLSRGAEGENEWVEVYNQTDLALDITGWSICDNTSCDLIPATAPIPSLGYALITASSTTAAFWNFPPPMPVIILPDGDIGNGLNNDNDMLILKRPDSVIMDQMNYGPSPDTGWTNYNSGVWNPGATDVAEGSTLARNPSGYDTDQPSDWVELGIPVVNLIYPGPYSSESWYWSSTYDIQWTATNPNGPDSALSVDLYFIKDIDGTETITPADTIETVVLGTANDGHYDFTVPDGFIGYVWVKIVVTGPENPMLNDVMTSARIWDPPPATMTAAQIAAEVAEEEEDLADAETVGDTTVDPTALEEIVGDALNASVIAEASEETETSAATEANVENQTQENTETNVVSAEEGTTEGISGGVMAETPTLDEVGVPTENVGKENTEIATTTTTTTISPTAGATEVSEGTTSESVSNQSAGDEIIEFNLLRREEDEMPEAPVATLEGGGEGPEPETTETSSEPESTPESDSAVEEAVIPEIPETEEAAITEEIPATGETDAVAPVSEAAAAPEPVTEAVPAPVAESTPTE